MRFPFFFLSEERNDISLLQIHSVENGIIGHTPESTDGIPLDMTRIIFSFLEPFFAIQDEGCLSALEGIVFSSQKQTQSPIQLLRKGKYYPLLNLNASFWNIYMGKTMGIIQQIKDLMGCYTEPCLIPDFS